jgi:hypothetical protein
MSPFSSDNRGCRQGGLTDPTDTSSRLDGPREPAFSGARLVARIRWEMVSTAARSVSVPRNADAASRAASAHCARFDVAWRVPAQSRCHLA